MRLFVSLIATVAFFAASAASASMAWTVDARTSDGAPLDAVNPDTQLILDITARTSAPGEALGLAGAVGGYDTSILSANAGASLISAAIFNGFSTGPGTGFGGLPNQRGGALPLQEEPVPGGIEFEFFAGVGTVAAAADGSTDIGIAAPNDVGGAQFRVVLDILPTAAGSTNVKIGTFEEFLDAYTGASDNLVSNVELTVTVIPEPGTALLMGIGLAGLAAAGRRD